MPTKAGIATITSAILCLIAGRLFGLFELYIIAAAMLALVACACLCVVLNWRSLQVSRQVAPARLHAGSSSTITLNLSNHRIVPTPVARITDEIEGSVRADANVPPIRKNASTRASYRVPTQTRGRVEIGPMKTRVTDPFGMASSTRTSAPDASLLVLPRIDIIAPPPQPGGSLSQQYDRSPNRVGANGDEFSSLRAYATGDDLRKVHWPSSARTGDLVVRTEQVPEQGQSLVLLDTRETAANAETFELMVSAAASIVVACAERGDSLRLVTTAGADESAETASEYDRLLDMLALVKQTPASALNLAYRPGRGGPEAGAMVLGADSQTVIATLPAGPSGMRSTYVVRFQPGAKPIDAPIRLTSSRMIDIESDELFADAWARAVGR